MMTVEMSLRVGFSSEGTIETLAQALHDEFSVCRGVDVAIDRLAAALVEWVEQTWEHIDDAPHRWAWTAMAISAGAFDSVDTTDDEWVDAIFEIATERLA